MHPKDLSISDFTYDLPKEKIALYPIHPRDHSKLLIYRNHQISEDTYHNISDHLPGESVLIFNDTKVIKSRILFPKTTGAVIEIFCLEPYGEFRDHDRFLARTGSAQWKCMIGKAGKWKDAFLHKTLFIRGKEIDLRAQLVDQLPNAYVVELSWASEEISLGEIMDHAGVTPLPPYIKRPSEKGDESDYQTIYSEHEGSVAAPTAGLHFTDEMMKEFRQQGIPTLFTTLHVGAGTFKPVSSDTMEGHIMHEEWMHITTDFLKALLKYRDKKVISVGTTATRTMESIYWMGCKIIRFPKISKPDLKVTQWEIYESTESHLKEEAIVALLGWMKNRGNDDLMIETGIIITPGYTFRIVDGLITNFHMPQSTLLLLVAALIGNDWNAIYEYALKHDFRFLSYGDGSLLLP